MLPGATAPLCASSPALHRDDCRRALRKLELEAYSTVTSALRAQGHLTDERKNLLQALRGVLHISQDRHAAEARRAANDPTLATIAERLVGPNTDLDWTCEGRRKIPILPRGIPQTLYTVIADKAARLAAIENDRIASAPEIPETEEIVEEVETYVRSRPRPPVVMSDQSSKTMAEDGPPRKRSRTDPATPHGRPSHQKFLNLSQVYSSYLKTSSGKMSNQYGKSSHGQSGKQSGKSNHSHPSKSISKHRSGQNKHGKRSSGQVAIPHRQVRTGIKSPTDPHVVGSRALNVQSPVDSGAVKSQTSGFQANFAQSLVRIGDDPNVDVKPSLDSPTMQLLTQTALNRDANASDDLGNVNNRDVSGVVSQSPKIQGVSGKPCHLIIKKKSDNLIENNSSKTQIQNVQILSSKPADLSNLKVLHNRQVLLASSNSSPQNLLNSSGKLITTKMVQQIPQKSQAQMNTSGISKSHSAGPLMEKVLIVSKSPMTPTGQTSILQRSLSNSSSKNFIISNPTVVSPNSKDDAMNKNLDGDVSRSLTLNNTEMKLSGKTIFVDPKSGHKMVVVPSKSRPKGQFIGQQLLVKSLPNKAQTMKLLSVGNQSPGNQSKSTNLSTTPKSSLATLPKILPKEHKSYSPSNLNMDSSNEIPLNVQIYPKSSQPLVKSNTKGNLIVVQKSNNIAKGAISITKNGSDLSKVVMSNKIINSNSSLSPIDIAVNSALSDINDKSKNVCDTVSLDIKNEEMSISSGDLPQYLEGESAATALTPSESLNTKTEQTISNDSSTIFAQHVTDATCSADSMDSTTDSAMECINNEDTLKSNDSFIRQVDDAASLLTNDNSEAMQKQQLIADWEIESDNALDKQKIGNEVDDLRLALDVSSESDVEDFLTSTKGNRKLIAAHESNRGNDEISDETSELHICHVPNKTNKSLVNRLRDEKSLNNDSHYFVKDDDNLSSHVKMLNVQDMNFNDPKNQVHANMSVQSSTASNVSLQSKTERTDIFSTALTSADINLDSFEYMDDGMSAEEMFPLTKGKSQMGQLAFTSDKHHTIEHELVQLLNEDHVGTTRSIIESSQANSGAME